MDSRLYMVERGEEFGDVVAFWPVWKEWEDSRVDGGYRLTYHGVAYLQYRCPHMLEMALPSEGDYHSRGIDNPGLTWTSESFGKGKAGDGKQRHVTLRKSLNEFDLCKLSSGTTGGHNYRGPRVALMNDSIQHADIMHSEDRGWAIPPLTRAMKERGLRPNIRPHLDEDDQYHPR